jgi:pimeloyl-ACP methyl ester carboxylesterase
MRPRTRPNHATHAPATPRRRAAPFAAGPAGDRPSPGRRRGGRWLGFAIVALIGCAPAATTVVDGAAPLPVHDASLALRGPASAEVASGVLRSAYGCELRYEDHRPLGWMGGPTVVLAHGFLRSLDSMRGWAEHFASHGVRTVVVGLCNATPFDGRHDRSAVDLRDLADQVVPEGGRVLYAGFSAGGLAALLAAAEDPAAVAYLGLDAVDSGALAGRATRLAVPALFLSAEPGACNADGNMAPFAATIASARVVRVPNATHCVFEDPYDARCAWLCGRVQPESAAAAIRTAVRALATDFVRTQTGAP